MKKVNFISLLSLCFVMACTTSTAQKREITPAGVTGLSITDAKPVFSSPFTVEYFEDDYEGYSMYFVKDGDGNVVMDFYPGSDYRRL